MWSELSLHPTQSVACSASAPRRIILKEHRDQSKSVISSPPRPRGRAETAGEVQNALQQVQRCSGSSSPYNLVVPARILIGGPEVGALVPHVAWVVRAHAVLREDGLHPALRGRQLELRSSARARPSRNACPSARAVWCARRARFSLSHLGNLVEVFGELEPRVRRAGVVVSVCASVGSSLPSHVSRRARACA